MCHIYPKWSHLYIYMVITGVENASPDMSLVALDGKFDEKKDEIPPRICRPHIFDLFHIYLIFFNIGNLGADIKTKNCHTWRPRGSHMARIWHAPYYHIPKSFLSPKVFNLN